MQSLNQPQVHERRRVWCWGNNCGIRPANPTAGLGEASHKRTATAGLGEASHKRTAIVGASTQSRQLILKRTT